MAEAVTAAGAIGWGMKAAGWVASPVISNLFKKASSYLGFDASKKLSELEPKILFLERVMGAVEESPDRPRLEGHYSKLKSAFYEAEEILDDVEYYHLEKKIQDDRLKSEVAGPCSCLKQIWSAVTKSFPLQHQESGMSKVTLKEKLDNIEEVINDACKVLELMNLPSISGANQSQLVAANSRGSVTTSRPLSTVIGRDEDCDKIVAMLHEKEHGQPNASSAPCYSVIGIHGIGGSGKSTLAQLVCSREKKDGHFDLVIWVHVSQVFSVDTILKEISEAATGTLCPEYRNLDTLQDKLEKTLHGKRFFLVLDDVWCNIRDVTQTENFEQILSPLKAGEAGSKILVTSRTEDALLALGAAKQRCIPMSVLDEDVFWNLLMHYALHDVPVEDHARRILEDIGKEIAKKLKGSPLAARIVGGQLRRRQNVVFWRSVRDRDLLNETMGALWWSYHHLHEQVKRCFAYCSMFPRRHCLERYELVRLWAAEGFAGCISEGEEMEDVCQEYFEELVSASFLQLRAKESPHDKEYYLVHDLLHDLAEKAAGSDCFRIENSLKRGGKCPAVEVPPDVRHIFVEYYNEEVITEKICKLKNLRTVIFDSAGGEEPVGEQALKCMFERLKKLRVLTITITSPSGICSFCPEVLVPACIDELRHLRYFSCRSGLNHTLSMRLVVPATLSKLYHMQVLDFGGIQNLVFSRCEDLINLRHVVCIENVGIPSVGRLTSLRTMRSFNVRKEQGYELKQLGNLNKLGGQLLIRGLGNVESKAEALEANLVAKERLTKLKLSWSAWQSSEASPEVQAEVLDGLCPPEGLESLSIEDYLGTRYPNWMHTGGPKYLNHLKLNTCSVQPGPELLVFCTHLRKLGIEFCSWDTLPDYMEDLTSLKSLDISFCRNIRSLPTLPRSLEHFRMSSCDEVLMSSCCMEHLTSLQTLEIVFCNGIRSLPVLPQSLEQLSLEYCDNVSVSSCCMEHLSSLQTLKISSCDSIRSLPTLPESIKEFELFTKDEVLLSSCKTVGDPDWQKIKHIPHASIKAFGAFCVMKMGAVQDQKHDYMGSEAGGSSPQEHETS